MGITLTHKGEGLVKHGVDDDGDNDDGALVREVMARAPGMSYEDYQQAFVALRLEYGTDALRAIRTGHVQFELVKPRDRTN